MAMLSGDDSYNILIKTEANTSAVKDLENKLGGLQGATEKNHTSFLKMGAAVAAGQAAFTLASKAISGMAGFLGDTVKSANESENAISQMEAALKSTHSAAGLYDDELVNMAESLQKVTTFSDEAVLGAESLLLTFTNVKGQVFKDSVPLILDMSQALGQDLKSSTMQLGKALNDPIRGISALTKVGVTFTEKQKDTVASLVEMGRTAEAQQLILKELRTEFGGSAEAAGKTFAGSLARLKNQFDNVKESVGGLIVKGLTPFVSKAASFLAAIDWDAAIAKTTGFLNGLWYAISGDGVTKGGWEGKLQQYAENIRNFGLALWEVAKKIEDYLEPKFIALWNTIEDKLLPQLEKLWHNVIEPLIPIIGGALVLAFGLVVDAINFVIDAITIVLTWLEKHKLVAEILIGVLGTLATALIMKAAFTAVMGAFTTLTTVTIPAAIGALGTLNAALVGFGGFAVLAAAAAIAFMAIMNGINDTKKALDGANSALDDLSKSTDSAMQKMKKSFEDGKITAEQYAKNIKQIAKDANEQVADNKYRPSNVGKISDFFFGNAIGDSYSSGGMRMVGENGPELVNLPRGAKVNTAGQTKDILSGDSGGGSKTTVNYNAPIYLQTAQATKEFFDVQDRNSLLARKGLSVVRL